MLYGNWHNIEFTRLKDSIHETILSSARFLSTELCVFFTGFLVYRHGNTYHKPLKQEPKSKPLKLNPELVICAGHDFTHCKRAKNLLIL